MADETIVDKIKYLNETKSQIKEAIISKGTDVEDNTSFRNYVQKIKDMPITGPVTIEEYNDSMDLVDDIIGDLVDDIIGETEE
jgi:hypothetical protein